ncbi:MAG: sugar phosphate isomerase/epimerase [Chloroflexi bacterium]|nr:sugar phosphate isomerase/epimerase [Chloroflexota bacterium]
MNHRFGVSTSLCVGQIKKLARGTNNLAKEQLLKGYLSLLDDFARFVLKNGFDSIEIEFGFSIISAELLLPLTGELRNIIRPFREVSCHLPLGEVNIAALHPAMRREAIAETKRHIDLCDKLGIQELVMHPGCFGATPDRYALLEKQTRQVAERSVFEIAAYCKKKHLQLSIENLHRSEALFRKAEEFEPFARKGIGITLDTVHAFVSGVNPLDFITRFGRKIREVHLTDGVASDSYAHYALGTGEVDCTAVLRKLEEIGFDGRIVLEVNSKKALIESKAFLKGKGFFR